MINVLDKFHVYKKNLAFLIAIVSVFAFGFMYRMANVMVVLLVVIAFSAIGIFRQKVVPLYLDIIVLFLTMWLCIVREYRSEPLARLEWSNVPYLLAIFFTFTFGIFLAGRQRDKIDKRIFLTIITLMVGMYLQTILDYYYKVKVPVLDQGHMWYGFWSHDIEARNTFDLGFILLTASVFFAYKKRKEIKALFIFVVIGETIAIILNLINAGRTNLFMLPMIFAILLCFYSYNYWAELSKNKKCLIIGGFSFFTLAMAVLFVLVRFNLIDAGKNENDKFLARGGGVFNNIRFKMAISGFKHMIENPLGGWDVTVGDVGNTHNTWLEYGRIYDISIFCLLAIFLIIIVTKSIRLLAKHGYNNDIVFLLVGSYLSLFIYFTMEPNGFSQKIISLPFFLLCGLVSGYHRVINKVETEETFGWDLGILNKTKYADIPLVFLAVGLITVIYIDFRGGRLDVVEKMLIPLACYCIGRFVKSVKGMYVILTGLCAGLAMYTFVISRNTEFFLAGYVIEPFSGNVATAGVLYILLIPLIAVIVGGIFYKCKLKLFATSVITVVFSLLLGLNVIRDGRIHNMIDAVHMLIVQPWGSFEIKSAADNSSHNMWLDYGRDYGMTVLAFLLLFLVSSVVSFIIYILKTNTSGPIQYMIIVAYILINEIFMVDAVFFIYTKYFAMGLIVLGLMQQLFQANMEKRR
ncbi:MAG: hypothetical protein K5773_05355 [Pseudobutyrivibrio sp.]|nr:hypothetical protein [Pseudobutyrivibrio sp.]